MKTGKQHPFQSQGSVWVEEHMDGLKRMEKRMPFKNSPEIITNQTDHLQQLLL